MKLLLTGACGFTGSILAAGLREAEPSLEIIGLDNFSRQGSYLNREPLRQLGVELRHGDVRAASDLESIGKVDWIIDAAANPSVLAGLNATAPSRQLLEQNLYGTVNLLELAKTHGAGFILLSTSRVYSIQPLSQLRFVENEKALQPAADQDFPRGMSVNGVTEEFSTQPPISLYGASKLASELLAQEYAETFGFPVWINRCGVLAGAGQFGRADQGIFAFWINSYLRHRQLSYIGFDGRGTQTRDCLHPRDLVPLLLQQMRATTTTKPIVANFAGGNLNAMSLAQLSAWCAERFGPREIQSNPTSRRFDVPWLVLDSAVANKAWNWKPATSLSAILEEIADHAEKRPDWLEISGAI